MGIGRTATVGFQDSQGSWHPVSVDNPLPTSGGGSTSVTSVNGQTGTVVLDAADIGAQPAGDYATTSQLFDGEYSSLTGKPTIPKTAADVGALPDTYSPSLSDIPAGSVIGVTFDGTDWVFNGAAVTTRPTSRTDVIVAAYGGTAAPTFAIAGDVWIQGATVVA